MTSFENIYYETTEQTHKYLNFDHTRQRISVAIRRWFCDFSPLAKEDVVLHTIVIANGEVVKDLLQFLPVGQELAWYQRKGILAFDDAIARHPYFSQQKLQTISA